MKVHIGLERIREITRNKTAWKNIDLVRVGMLAAFLVILTATIALDKAPWKSNSLAIGRPSSVTLKADRDIVFIDSKETAKAKDKAKSAVDPVFRYDAGASLRAQKTAQRMFAVIDDARILRRKGGQAARYIMPKAKGLSSRVAQIAAAVSYDELDASQGRTFDIINQVMAARITPTDVAEKRSEVYSIVSNLPIPYGMRQLVAEVASISLEPNYIHDQEATQELQDKALSRVKPVLVKKLKGEEVVREGEIVTRQQMDIIGKLGLKERSFRPARWLGAGLLASAILLLLGIWLARYHPTTFAANKKLAMMGALGLTTLVLGKILGAYPYLTPVPAVGLLGSILLGPEIAVLLVLMVAVVGGGLIATSLSFLVVMAASGVLAAYLGANISERNGLMRAGGYLAGGLAAVAFGVGLVVYADISAVLRLAMWGFVGGVVSAIATVGSLPFFEYAFGVTTDMRLIELSNPDQPLLHELMISAPGTYSHSVMTGNLVESAAKLVGANPVLCRVAAYYHDIGKIRRPMFFAENQLGKDNPHDKTKPNLSYLVVSAHVREGVEMARSNGLPEEVVQVIAEHHGTSVLQYFFHRAGKSGKEAVSETDFRYDGPRPSSREAALVMLADSVEAAARAISKPSPTRLETVARKVVAAKFEDGQLDESDLTLADIEKITKSFSQVLAHMYHTRVEYPSAEPRSDDGETESQMEVAVGHRRTGS